MSAILKSSTGARHAIGQREFVVLMAAMMSLNALAIDGMLPALDEIAQALVVPDPNDRQLVVGAYLLAGGVGCLWPGLFADRFGRRPVLFASMALYIVFALACGMVQSFPVLLAMRAAQGFFGAGLVVLPSAIIRDRFEGDKMAQLLSMIFIVFMVVPVLAPSLGQAVLLFASWRWVFVTLAVLAVFAVLWAWSRLPETLHPENRQEIDIGTVLRNLPLTFRTRESIGYVFAAGLTFGGVFGYINMSQQLLGEHFGVGEDFPIYFGITASTLALSSFVNSRIVERFGARRVSHTGLLLFVGVSVLQVIAALYAGDSLAIFLPLMAGNLCLLGFLGANFGSIAMQPFYDTAGAASSVQAFVRMVLGAVLGIVIGRSYNDSALPLAIALLVCSIASLGLVLYSENGRLFRRLHKQYRPERPRE